MFLLTEKHLFGILKGISDYYMVFMYYIVVSTLKEKFFSFNFLSD